MRIPCPHCGPRSHEEVSCFGDATGPGEFRHGRVAIAPLFDARAIRVVDVNRVRLRHTGVAEAASSGTGQLTPR